MHLATSYRPRHVKAALHTFQVRPLTASDSFRRPKGGSCGGNKFGPYHFRDRYRGIRWSPTVHRLRPQASVLLRIDNFVLGHPIESFPNGLEGTVAGPIPE